MVLQEGLVEVKVAESDRDYRLRKFMPSRMLGKIVDSMDRIVCIGNCSWCRNPVFSNEKRCKDQTGSYLHMGCCQGPVSPANPAGGKVQHITSGYPTTSDTCQEMVHTLMSKAGIDNVQDAQQFLEQNNWDLDVCLQRLRLKKEVSSSSFYSSFHNAPHTSALIQITRTL